MRKTPWSLSGILSTEAVVFPNDTPAYIKMLARAAKSVFGAAVQVCDGTADQTEINAAIDHVDGLGKGEVMLMAYGNFSVSGAVVLKSNVVVTGHGQGTPHLVPSADIDVVTGTNISATGLHRVGIYNSGSQTSKAAIRLDSVSFSTFRDVVINSAYDGLVLESTETDDNTTRQCTFDNFTMVEIAHRGVEVQKDVHDCFFANFFIDGKASSDVGLKLDATIGGRAGLFLVGGNHFNNFTVLDFDSHGIEIDDWIEVVMVNVFSDSNGGNGLDIRKSAPISLRENMSFTNLWLGGNTGYGLYVKGDDEEDIVGLSFVNMHINGNDDGMAFSSDVEYCYVNATVTANAGHGVMLAAGANHNIFDGCICHYNGENGIRCAGDNNILRGCLCSDNNRTNSTFNNITLVTADYNLLEGCKCRKGTYAVYGISVYNDDCTRNCLIGNDLYDSGVTGDLNDAASTNPTLKKSNRNLAGTGWLTDV